MNIIFRGSQYVVMNYPETKSRGIEILDLVSRKGTFLDDTLAEDFREKVARLITEDSTVEIVENFLDMYKGLMVQNTKLH